MRSLTRVHRILLAAAAGGLALYAAAGFLLAPALLKPRLLQAIAEATDRPVRLGDLRINPFTLSLTLENFVLSDRDSSRLVSFERLHVNYELSSLIRNATVLSAFELDTPYVAVRVMQDGRLGVADLFEPTGSPDTAGSESAAPQTFVIEEFRLVQGSIVYADLSRAEGHSVIIDSLDLFLRDFTTAPNDSGEYSFEATTRSRELLVWRGTVGVNPLSSSGRLEIRDLRAGTLWEFMRDRLAFGVESGLMDVRAAYAFDGGGDTARFSLHDGSLQIRRLVLTVEGDSIPPVSFDRIRIGGVHYAWPAQELRIGHLRLEDGAVRAAYLADGTLTLQNLLTPSGDPADTAASAFRLVVDTVTTSGLGFTFIERLQEPEAVTALSDISLTLRNLCYGTPGTARLAATGVLNGGGSLTADGTITLAPQTVTLDIDLRDSPIPPLQPYVTRYSRAVLAEGTMSVRGTMEYADRSPDMLLRFRGGVTAAGGKITDPVLMEDLMRWSRVELKNVDYTHSPRSLAVGDVATRGLFLRMILDTLGMTNFQHLAADTAGAGGRLREEPAASAAAPMATTIGAVTVSGGTLDFTDLSLRPNFRVSIEELGGAVRGLSSAELSRADVDLRGKVNRYAPALISGQINPLSSDAYTDITMTFDGIDLTTFTPYAGKFAGYTIDKGKLHLDLQYKLNKRYLEGKNRIILEQLTLGDEVEGPDVTGLPVKLAIALLKDSKGVIDLDIPVSGSVDDPDFSIFPVILQALMNLLWKIVTAPFALIGALFGGGGGEELDHVEFSAGSDSLDAAQVTRLGTVAKGLAERPALQLDVRGTASDSLDRMVLAGLTVMKEMGRPDGSLPAEQDRTRLLAVYRKRFNADPLDLVPEESLPAEERLRRAGDLAWRRLLDSTRVTESDLQGLARRRATAVVDRILLQSGIDASRVFLLDPDIAGGGDGGRVKMPLILTAK